MYNYYIYTAENALNKIVTKIAYKLIATITANKRSNCCNYQVIVNKYLAVSYV